jgi:hypothetical protein
VITDLGDTIAPPHPKNKTEVGRRMALQALHVAYAYQSLSANSSSSAQLPYDGFADGPILVNATASADANTVTVYFRNADGMMLKPTHSCGISNDNGSTSHSCCMFDRNFEVSRALMGDQQQLWDPVPAANVRLYRDDSGVARVQLSIASVEASSSSRRVRSNAQMYPQCVLINSAQLVAAPFLVNVSSTARSYVASALLAPAQGVSLTPPMGFNSYVTCIDAPWHKASLAYRYCCHETRRFGFYLLVLSGVLCGVRWNFYHCNIDERAIKQIALALKSTGLAAAGYK